MAKRFLLLLIMMFLAVPALAANTANQPLSSLLPGPGNTAGVDLENECKAGSVLPQANGGSGTSFPGVSGNGRLVGADATFSNGEWLLVVDSSAGDVTITLPSGLAAGSIRVVSCIPSANTVHVVPSGSDEFAGMPALTFDIKPNAAGPNVDVRFTAVHLDSLNVPPLTPFNQTFWGGEYFDRYHMPVSGALTSEPNQQVAGTNNRQLIAGTNITFDTSVANELKINGAAAGVSNPMTVALDAGGNAIFNVADVIARDLTLAKSGVSQINIKNDITNTFPFLISAGEEPATVTSLSLRDPGLNSVNFAFCRLNGSTGAIPFWTAGSANGGYFEFNANVGAGDKRQGTGTTTGGTATINTTAVTATCLIFVTAQANLGDIYEVKASRVNNTSFRVDSAIDGAFAWMIVEP